jgi:8-oxo-dGTP pyrophosphatase MutT (NUDIX family)
MARPRADQVAALPWRKRRGSIEILLITSRETRRWVIPKGWPMANLLASNAAKREAYEEAGIDGRVRRKAIGRYTYIKRVANRSRQTCIVAVYALNVARVYGAWPERKQRRRFWFAAEVAAGKVREAELRSVIRAFAAACLIG